MAEYDTPTLEDPEDAVEEEVGYWTSEEEVKEAVHLRRRKADRNQSQWRQEASDAYRFVAGEQWSDEDVRALEANKRPCVTFNRVGPIVNAICGQQISNRQETRYLPREGDDLRTAEQWTQVASWVREQCDAEDEESDSFRDLVITGMGWTCMSVTYDEDQDGKIVKNRIDPRRFRWDPAARKKNLADARWVQCDWWFSREELREKWPDAEDLAIAPNAFGESDNSAEPHDATNDWRYETNAVGKDLYNGQYRAIHEIHWRLEDVYQLADVDGKITKLTKKEYDQLTARLLSLGMPAPQVAKTQMRVYYECWVVGGTVLGFNKYPHTGGFEYQAMTGLRDEDGDWYGIVKALMDPQRFANKIFSQILAIINDNAKGGLVAEESAVENKRKFEAEWSKSNGVAWVADGAVSNGKIQPKPPPQIPTQLQQLLEYSIGGMREVTGVNVEFLGQTDKVQPGVVEAMRTKAGLVILAPWFDAMRLYMKRDGRVLAEFINTYIADGRWIRVTGQEGAQYVQLTRNPGALRYDIIVDEATMSRDSRERSFLALMQIIPMAMQSGVPIPPDVIDYAPIPETLRLKWKQMVQEKAQQPPQPPLQVMVEQMRGENAKALEAMRAQQKQQQSIVDAQTERVVQAAQAESERMIEDNKGRMQLYLGQIELMQDKQKMVMESKLQTFETVLNAIVDMQTKMAEIHMKAQAQQEQMASRHVEMAQNQGQMTDAVTSVMQIVRDMQDKHAEQIGNLAKIMMAPDEIVRDKNGRVSGKRKVLQ